MNFDQPYNRHEFVNFLRQNFLPENDFVQEETPVAFPTQTQYCCDMATRLGSSKSLGLDVYEIRHHSKSDARVGMSKEAFRLLYAEGKQCALVIFLPEDSTDNYRFSFIEITLHQDEDSSRVKKTYSNPRRYSYYLGKGVAWHTPNKYLNKKNRVTSIEDLRNRFSVEVLTKSFYQELSDWYAWAIDEIRFPNKLDNSLVNKQANAEGAIRLITRLIFVWFLKQKELIPNDFFDENAIREKFIEDFEPNKREDNLFGYKSKESVYYKAILQNLFFAMLNCPVFEKDESRKTVERKFRRLDENGKADSNDFDDNKLMRYEKYFKNPKAFIEVANRTIPFLNGGLFDCLDDKRNKNYIDGFSDKEEVQKKLIVPDYLFFGEEIIVDLSNWYKDKKKKKVKVSGILNILKRYNFTVEENTPFDQEVSLDPELLGKVFENLLASYNPETQTTARKQTGSFYTPREIVQYMVDESLVAHLKRIVGEDLESEFRKLVAYTDEEPNLTDEQKHQIMEAIYNCKVLDPACGSGAFPVGMLQQMVHILSRLDPSNDQWKKMILDEAANESRNAFLAETSEERKKRLNDINETFEDQLKNSDYTRKLYLIENCLYGVDIQSIAIQICKLRFFISLVVDQETNNNPEDNFGIRPLPNLEAKFVAANTLIGLEKKDVSLFDDDNVKKKMQELKGINHRLFYVKHKAKKRHRAKIRVINDEIAALLKDNGVIDNEEAQQLSQWNRFNQNTSASFFDAEWMFGVKDGFDIVIGNPPYVNAMELKKNLGSVKYEELKKHFCTAKGTVDFYVYFFEIGYKLLCNNGVLAYITPNKYLCANYGKSLRNFFIQNLQILVLLDVSRNNIFDASIYPVVTLLRKKDTKETYSFISIDKNNTVRHFSSTQLTDFPENIWGFLMSSKYDLTKRIVTKCNSILYYCKINATSTASEADKFHSYISEQGNGLKLINTGTIDPFINFWGVHELTDKGVKYLYPTLPNNVQILGKSRYAMYNSPKIIVSKMSLSIEGFWDKKGEYSSINTNCLYSINIAPQLLLGWIHSKLFHYIYECYFEGLKMSGGYLPFSAPYLSCMCIPTDLVKCTIIIELVDEIINGNKSIQENMNLINLYLYKICDLTYDEILIVDPKTFITRVEYEATDRT